MSVQMLQKLRTTPGFLQQARRAMVAYGSQLEAARVAVTAWQQREGWTEGEPVSWQHRPEASDVSL